MKRFLQRWSYLAAMCIALLILFFAASDLIAPHAAHAPHTTPLPCLPHEYALPSGLCVPSR